MKKEKDVMPDILDIEEPRSGNFLSAMIRGPS